MGCAGCGHGAQPGGRVLAAGDGLAPPVGGAGLAPCCTAPPAAPPCPQLTLDLEASSISTKGTKSGAFVMYNCARLATLFDTYQRAVEQGECLPCYPRAAPRACRLLWPQPRFLPSFPGTYPPLPPASTLNFSCLREEVSAEGWGPRSACSSPGWLLLALSDRGTPFTGRMAPAFQLPPALPRSPAASSTAARTQQGAPDHSQHRGSECNTPEHP